MNPNIVCLTDTIKVLSFYAVVAYGIYCMKAVVIAFIGKRAELLDLFSPRTPEEITIDNARRMGLSEVHEDPNGPLLEFPTEDKEVH